MKKYVYGALASLPSFLAGSALFAQESSAASPTTTTLVDTAGIQATITSSIGPWLIIGLGIGISLVVVWIGWSWIKKFIKSK